MKKILSSLQIDVVKGWINSIRNFFRGKKKGDVLGNSPYAIW